MIIVTTTRPRETFIGIFECAELLRDKNKRATPEDVTQLGLGKGPEPHEHSFYQYWFP